jgi:hypothetical protein
MKNIVAYLGVGFFAAAFAHAEQTAYERTHRVGLTYDDSRLTEFHKRVLSSMGLEYTTEQESGRTTVSWAPRSKAEADEVQARVSQYGFAIRGCPVNQWPEPETPSGTIMRCPKP